jgi:hypothetical protein
MLVNLNTQGFDKSMEESKYIRSKEIRIETSEFNDW